MKKVTKYISLLLCVTVFLTSVLISSTFNVGASEAPIQTGTVKNVDPYLNVRSGAGSSYNAIGMVYSGQSVTIYAYENGWYKIAYGSGFGYVSASYIINVQNIPTQAPEYDYDADFETNLSNQNFPESYKEKLRLLHAAHPNWIFMADHLTMTFAEAVNNEAVVGKSLVQNSVAKDSWKSMMPNAYDWTTGKYVSYDSGGWVTAEREVVEYYMEPRNFLDENGIYMFLDQSYNPNIQTKDGLQLILNGTFMAGAFPEDTHATYADVIMEAAQQSGVSPYVLAAMIIIEQGSNGAGASISGTQSGYEGYYNFFNIRAYKVDGYSAVAYGLLYAKGGSNGTDTSYDRPWNSRAKSIIGGAKYYFNGYLSRGQDNLYYKKFNVITPTFYINQYMTNVQGAYGEAGKLKNGYSTVSKDAALVFSIPVYKEMPETNNTALPTSSGANNYYITSLSVGGQAVAGFNLYKNSYELSVTSASNVIDISATVPSGATVSGAGSVALQEGTNTITLKVTAASGKEAYYTLYIMYFKDENGSGSGLNIESIYNMSTYISGISVGTDVDTFLKNFTVTNGYVEVFDKNYTRKTSGVIATGDRVIVFDANYVQKGDYGIVIFGDVNGDGKISISDLGAVQRHLLEVNKLSGNQATAADVNKDGKISILDLGRVQRHLLELIVIN